VLPVVYQASLAYLKQEHIEPAKPAREHVTTIDGEIQTGCRILILVTFKYGKAATCACIAAFLEFLARSKSKSWLQSYPATTFTP